MKARRIAASLLRIASGPHPHSQFLERLRERLVVLDAATARLTRTDRTFAIGVGFSYEKRRLLRFLYPDRRFLFLPSAPNSSRVTKLLHACPEHELWSWSYADPVVEETLRGQKKRWMRVEDGFIRSNGLGVQRAVPHSFCIDRTGLYFDATNSSELEALCLEFDTHAQADLVRRAECLIRFLIQRRVTKYAAGSTGRMQLPRGSVLVLGQVEDDKSILCNPRGLTTNRALVEAALAENDTKTVYYRPHPDVATGIRRSLSKPEELVPQQNVIPADMPISTLFDSAAHVYTISSLGGFEALMRGVQVSTFGGPFYAGWGLTRDYLTFPRRNRTLTVAELFACAYILYPVYFDPKSGRKVQIEDTIAALLVQVAHKSVPDSSIGWSRR